MLCRPRPQLCEYDNCRILLVDKKISTARDIIGILEVREPCRPGPALARQWSGLQGTSWPTLPPPALKSPITALAPHMRVPPTADEGLPVTRCPSHAMPLSQGAHQHALPTAPPSVRPLSAATTRL